MNVAAGSNQIAGAVLEEAVLSVLGAAGFVPVENLQGDSCINPNEPAVTIRGRGTEHQIDAVADPIVGYPFSNPARLIVEAKAYAKHRRVGLDVVRNAVGTLKDISEFWGSANPRSSRVRRYHYRYAIFASTDFTKGAQEYAFAQDIYLLPLRRSAFFRPVVEAIDELRDYHRRPRRGDEAECALADYRKALREALRNGGTPGGSPELAHLVEAVQRVRYGLIAVAERQFPIFLIPERPYIIEELDSIETVRIFWNNEGWYLRRPGSNQNLFSFDLPDELFALYARGRELEQDQAIRLKAERLAVLQTILVQQRQVRVVQFELDDNWIRKLLRRQGG